MRRESAVRSEGYQHTWAPEVQTYVERKASDPDRWLRGMRRLRARSQDIAGE